VPVQCQRRLVLVMAAVLARLALAELAELAGLVTPSWWLVVSPGLFGVWVWCLAFDDIRSGGVRWGGAAGAGG
jgi:hypothetical protein